jgi:hypothetical protein
MKPHIRARTARPVALAAIALVALVSGGCSKKLVSTLVPNQAPEVRLTAAPVARDSIRPDFYAYTMRWVGYDPDGRVDHFLYSVDAAHPDQPDPSDTTWHTTVKNEQAFFFSAGTPIEPLDPRDPRGETPHVFAIYAVDNEGTISKRPAVRGFFSFTQCPIVQVQEPAPTSAFSINVTPTVTIKWTGQDPDGQFTTKPVRWVFRLFGQKNADYQNIQDYIAFALTLPDSMRRQYAPDFRGWNSVGADTTSFQYHNLIPGSTYLFVVTGFDEAGAYDPVFSPSRNMLQFSVTFAGTFGPIITMFNQFFFYTYPDGGYDASERRWFLLEVPADLQVVFNWFGTAPPGANMRRYRWVMDLVDLSDQTRRSNEATDWYHWSAWSLNTTAATIGPFVTNDEEHLFFIEAEDNNNLTSLGIIHFKVVRSIFDKDLLFVDDTRFRPDFRSTTGPNLDPPAGPWPGAAELDTFLFAKGGFPWKSYPTGTLSTPGIFNGYAYDTIGTRGISLDGTVPLSVLGRYKHVVWYTDEIAASYTQSPADPSTPISALRLVNSPGRPVILATYITQGGKVWLCGGGAAYATLIPWNRFGPTEYTARDNELIPGRMMYDFAHWRQGVQMLPAVQARRFGTTLYGGGGFPRSAGRNWPPSPLPPTPPAPPNYALLPTILQPKNPATDPVPPLRNPDSFFYRGDFLAEYIFFSPTFIREDYDDDPGRVSEFSTLDTLYITSGGTSLQNAACMTYYHGRDNQPFVFSGFNFWYWRRTQCLALVDWVLQSVWRIPRDASVPRTPSGPMSARRAAP